MYRQIGRQHVHFNRLQPETLFLQPASTSHVQGMEVHVQEKEMSALGAGRVQCFGTYGGASELDQERLVRKVLR